MKLKVITLALAMSLSMLAANAEESMPIPANDPTPAIGTMPPAIVTIHADKDSSVSSEPDASTFVKPQKQPFPKRHPKIYKIYHKGRFLLVTVINPVLNFSANIFVILKTFGAI